MYGFMAVFPKIQDLELMKSEIYLFNYNFSCNGFHVFCCSFGNSFSCVPVADSGKKTLESHLIGGSYPLLGHF